MRIWMLVAMLPAAVAVPAAANGPRDPQAIEILTRARAAAASIRSIRYQARYEGTGALANLVPVIHGQVMAKRGATNGPPKVFIEGTKVSPRTAKASPFRYACDGVTATSVHDEVKLCFTGSAAEGRSRERSALLPVNYLDPGAYRLELNAAVLQYAGVAEAAGVPCHVVLATYDEATDSKARFYIGREDYLLRRKETHAMVSRNAARLVPDAAFVFTAERLETNVAIEDTVFKLEPPAGYKRSGFEVLKKSPSERRAGGIRAARPKQRATGLPRVGQAAPDWTLKDSSGKRVSLKDLRGKVVVMDFWASWCGPCRRAMPGMQKLYQRFKDKPVAVFGVNCRERRAGFDPSAFMKKKGFTYPQLTNGNAVANAYGVRGIPAFFIIGKDGKLLHAGRGYSPQMEAQMGRIVEEALKQTAVSAVHGPEPGAAGSHRRDARAPSLGPGSP